MGKHTRTVLVATIGIDLGDKVSRFCRVDAEGRVVEEGRLDTTRKAFQAWFANMAPVRIAIEAGTHSRWADQLLRELGHTVLVGNPRKVRLISENDGKDDRVDARLLARLARADPELLHPIKHRGPEAHAALATLKARDTLVRMRARAVNHIRGSVKAAGFRLPKCSTEAFPSVAAEHLPPEVLAGLRILVKNIEFLASSIRKYDRQIERLIDERYREATRLMQVPGVGPITALAYVLTLEEPGRFKKSRSVGAYLGLRPKKSASGESDPQLRITKAGNPFLRRLLVQSAQYTLGPFGPDSDLRRWGYKIACGSECVAVSDKKKQKRGGKNAKKKAVTAVARKIAILLHRLWVTREAYEPLRNAAGAKDQVAAPVET